MRKASRILAGVVCAAASVASISNGAASAQTSVETSSQVAFDGSAEALVAWSKQPTAGDDLNDLYAFLHAASPWHQFPLWNLWGEQTPYTPDKERDFAAPRLVKREKDERFDVDRLWIESPAMRRVVQVQVQYPRDRITPAPMLYLLDGVSAPVQSGWLRKGDVQGALAHEHVTAIMPVEAGGTNYTDWNETDPYLGRSMWETVLIDELPGVLESSEAGIPFNGQRYIGGLSMGGSAAVRLANLHPDRFAGAFSVSGCYSSVNTTGRELFNLAARSMGGNPDLMWGRDITPQRIRNDVVANPAGIASMPTYIYSADGQAGPSDVESARTEGIDELFGNIVLEKMVNRCTHVLEDSLNAKGLGNGNVTFDYHTGGVHAWSYYKQQLPVAWANVTKGAYTY